MPDPSISPPRDWHEAFATLPLESPPSCGWNALSARLDARIGQSQGRRRGHRPRWPLWAGCAATLMLAIALPWRTANPPSSPPPASSAAYIASGPADPLEALYLESAQLEALLAVARDDRVSSATAALLAETYEERLALIDAALARPGLSERTRLTLWQARVDGLRSLTGFESNRRWLAAQGARYDGALVLVD